MQYSLLQWLTIADTHLIFTSLSGLQSPVGTDPMHFVGGNKERLTQHAGMIIASTHKNIVVFDIGSQHIHRLFRSADMQTFALSYSIKMRAIVLGCKQLTILRTIKISLRLFLQTEMQIFGIFTLIGFKVGRNLINLAFASC